MGTIAAGGEGGILGRPIFGRTYDPWDFAAYAGGARLFATEWETAT